MNRYLLLTDRMNSGGAERQLAYLAAELKKAGNEVRLLQFYEGKNHYESILKPYGIVTETLTEGRNGLKRAILIARIVRDWKPTGVICYKDGSTMAGCIARLLTRFNLIVSERNTTQRLTVKELIKLQLYRFATHIVPNSFSQAAFLDRHAKWLSKKVSVITNMVDVDKFHPSNNQNDNGIRHIVTTARVTPQKNILNYLDAIAIVKSKIKNVHFDWYGRIEQASYYNQIQQKIKKLDIADSITFHEHVTDVERIYERSDVFCLPSSYEGFPNVLCEAMASGVPCIASNVCDNPSILKNRKRLFNPMDPEEIALRLTEILSTPEKELYYERMQNREFIIRMCSPESFTEKYISLT